MKRLHKFLTRVLPIAVLGVALSFASYFPVVAEEDIVIDKSPDGISLILHSSSSVYRADKAIFYATIQVNEDTYFNITGVTSCIDYSYVSSIVEGRSGGKDYIAVELQINPAPSQGSRMYKLIKILCSNDKRLKKIKDNTLPA